MQTLEKLQAIIEISKNIADFLRLYHSSFRDFLLNKDRYKDFWIDEKEIYQILAAGYIQLMFQTFKKNICEMHTSDSLVSQVESN